MKTIVVACFIGSLLFSQTVKAQVYFGDGDDTDTILPVFRTDIESKAYEFLAGGHFLSDKYLILSYSPLSLRIWSPWCGWDVVTFFISDGSSYCEHFFFDGSSRSVSDEEKVRLLYELLKKKSPS